MSEREKILERIRVALRTAAPRPEIHGVRGNDATRRQLDVNGVLPAVGATPDDCLAQFQINATELRAEFHAVESLPALAELLKNLARAEGWRSIGAHRGRWIESLTPTLGIPVVFTDPGYDPRELERCDAGITECDALVAQTGTVVLTSRSAGGRVLSVLPPHHVVLARRDQLVASLPEAFALLRRHYGDRFPSMMTFITGPSRTGDIERILVLGAHGPRRLTILCV